MSSLQKSAFLYHLQVLESIDNVNWSKINHAYGPATDVPAQLRALAFGDEQERKRALHALYGNIWHQLTIYEATAFAVPFLVELVQNTVPDQEEVLSLIALIATGRSYLAVHQSLLGKWTAEDEEQLQREQKWVKAAKSAVAAHSRFFFELTESLPIRGKGFLPPCPSTLFSPANSASPNGSRNFSTPSPSPRANRSTAKSAKSRKKKRACAARNMPLNT